MLEGEGLYLLGNTLASGAGGRFHLDGAVLSAAVSGFGSGPAKYLIYKNFNRMPAL